MLIFMDYLFKFVKKTFSEEGKQEIKDGFMKITNATITGTKQFVKNIKTQEYRHELKEDAKKFGKQMTEIVGASFKETVKFGKGMANPEYRQEVKESIKKDLGVMKKTFDNNITHLQEVADGKEPFPVLKPEE